MYTESSAQRPPSSTGTNRTKGIWRIMVSVVPTRKTCCPEITSFWNTKWKGTNNAGLPSVRLAPVAYWTSYLQFGARRCGPITGWAADKDAADLYLEQWGLE